MSWGEVIKKMSGNFLRGVDGGKNNFEGEDQFFKVVFIFMLSSFLMSSSFLVAQQLNTYFCVCVCLLVCLYSVFDMKQLSI